MACPKRRKSKSKQKMRRGATRWSPMKLQNCSSCGTAKPGHIVCPSCGYYGDRQVETIEAAA